MPRAVPAFIAPPDRLDVDFDINSEIRAALLNRIAEPAEQPSRTLNTVIRNVAAGDE